MSSTQITALLDLLHDDSDTVRAAVAARFRELGHAGLTALEEARDSADAHLRARARILLHEIRIEELCERLSGVLSDGDCDLETASVLLARIENPEVDGSTIIGELDRLGDLVADELASCQGPRQRAEVLGRVLAEREGFNGNADDYYEPKNSFINHVLQQRLGIPISLSAIYMMVGRRAGLSLRGVGMPCHFLVQFETDGETFFIDPFGGGRILTRESCKAMLAGFRHSWREEYLQPVEDRQMVRRMMANLIHIYHKREDSQRLDRLYGFVNDIQGGQS